MRDVMIYTEKSQFWPGDEVSGHVVVSTDETFTCNRIILKLRGKEYTHYQAGKVHVSETHQILEDDLTIWEGGNIHSGDTKFEFNFRLPEEIPPTHSGYFGQIDYSIEAVVELDRALDPKSKVDLNVFARVTSYIPEPLDRLPIREEEEHLHAEIPTDILRPNKGLEVRFLVKERSRIKGVRLDIVKHDDVVCQGRTLDSNTGVSEKRIPITYRDFDRWIEETIHEDWSSMGPFEGRLIKSSLMLKVVLEVGLSFDPCIEFPLRLSGEKEKEDEVFDSIELDLGW
ncbi:MAG: sporulation protein [Candidatus Thorarchaeota archaeon]